MLNQVQFAGKIRDLEAGRLSVGDFEEWFREASRDVHLWGDEQLNEVVFSTEDIFSQYHFEDLDETKMKQGLRTPSALLFRMIGS